MLGVLVRVTPLGAGEHFPLNDGGMFYAMVEDIKSSNYRLPEHTSYNGGNIPFAYPSLPFYMGAAVSDVTDWSTLDVLITLPLLFSLLTIVAFYALARAMLPTERMACLAVLVFAVIPRSFNWEIVGGGLTRSPGFFFALLAIWQGYLLFTTPGRRRFITTSILSALTIFFHMEMGWFVAFSLVIIIVSRGWQKENILKALILGPSVLVLTAPWWLETILRVGFDPFLSAVGSGGHSIMSPLQLLTLNFTEEPGFPMAIAFGVLGILAAIRDRKYFLPVWLLVIFILDARKPGTLSTAPLAMLAAYGIVDVFLPLVRDSLARLSARRATAWAYLAVGFALMLYAPIATISSSSEARSPLYALSEENRTAMEWIRTNTPPAAKFIVMPSTTGWGWDAPSEWFPVLAGRVSLTTVQGSEWLGASTYNRRQENTKELTKCTSQGVACLQAWARNAELDDYAYIYVPKGSGVIGEETVLGRKRDCCAEFRASLAASEEYVLVFNEPGAAVFKKRD